MVAALCVHMSEAEAAMRADSPSLAHHMHSHLHRAAHMYVISNIKATPHRVLRYSYRQHINWLVLTKLKIKLPKLWLQFTTYCIYINSQTIVEKL